MRPYVSMIRVDVDLDLYCHIAIVLSVRIVLSNVNQCLFGFLKCSCICHRSGLHITFDECSIKLIVLYFIASYTIHCVSKMLRAEFRH